MPDAATSRGLRFSILTLLLATTIAVLSLALWRLNGDIQPLRNEAQRLRNEVGAIDIVDPSRIHVAKRKCWKPSYNYRWRVYVPEGGRGSLWYALNDIPQQGLPSMGGSARTGSVGLPPGEYNVEFRINKDDIGSGWNLDLIGPRASSGYGGKVSWLPKVTKPAEVEDIGTSVKIVRPKSATILLRERYLQIDQPLSDLAPGLMIWIEAK